MLLTSLADLSMGLKRQCEPLKKGNACLQPLMGADIIIGRQTGGLKSSIQVVQQLH